MATLHEIEHNDCSLNALVQALKLALPDSTKKEFFSLLGINSSRLTTARYWEQGYNIKAWEDRLWAEREAATKIVQLFLNEKGLLDGIK